MTLKRIGTDRVLCLRLSNCVATMTGLAVNGATGAGPSSDRCTRFTEERSATFQSAISGGTSKEVLGAPDGLCLPGSDLRSTR